ncbi:MAG: hypothetical protein JO336_11460 [Acidobacteriia bacterium]|nr:hypothetical protein [Terriglobia bacterium]MBV8905118.1 hypothetical protein [Terriglobia bacterium]
MFLSSAGNVGIGTTSPASWAALDVDGTLSISGGAGSPSAAIITSEKSGLPLLLKATPGNVPVLFITTAGYVGIGTTDPCTNPAAPMNCKLSVAGAIQAQDVTVNTGWADYVFDLNYRLAPLSEIAGYIEQHHHLPDIPSAAEVQQNGVNLGDMHSKLLAKIEELTLHMIQAEKENQQLRDRIARLEAQNSTR